MRVRPPPPAPPSFARSPQKEIEDFETTEGAKELHQPKTADERREMSMSREPGKRKLGSIFWPVIVDEGTARKAARHGAAICGYSAAASLIVAFAGFGWVESEYEKYGLIVSSIIYAVLGLGILRMWRAAAIMALLLFVGDTILSIINFGEKHIAGMILLPFFISGIRGTFYYHKNVLPNRKTAMDKPITPT